MKNEMLHKPFISFQKITYGFVGFIFLLGMGFYLRSNRKNVRHSATAEVIKFLSVSSAVLGSFAIAYFAILSAFSFISSGSHSPSGNTLNMQQGMPYDLPYNSALGLPAGSFAQQQSTGAFREVQGATMQAHALGAYAGLLMVLLGAVTLKYTKLRARISSK